ncbi:MULTISPECIES: hypothetical protein [Sphingobium]|uniref:Uncharacterized protein n=1 Tax=Sphingobium cupriresistens LL01 TaxID=1420583 RepID=A0A0J7Y4Z3_9SPHN|nr:MULTISPECIES: hypothetical protein [Sphingobium]KMS58732.1 hypothetical protein V473_05145 [Sphingobium cupriresistens LL01]MBJ7378836.1 hypothetical protein [Sphingobium sp.]WCP14681.1 hypothetical protein sphantq_03130 [Sphingobium sp. AntQ-1]
MADDHGKVDEGVATILVIESLFGRGVGSDRGGEPDKSAMGRARGLS